MFKRKIEKEFSLWKESLKIKRRALLVKGLRQVGKTTSILNFAKRTYKNVVYLNFKANPKLKEIFSESLDVDYLLLKLSLAFPKNNFTKNETVIIFDEVQECSGARASVKYFMEDDRFDIIESGSLLGIKGYNNCYHGGIPVGFEYTVYMKPMDFEEFLWALQIKDEAINIIKNSYKNKENIDPFLNSLFEQHFNNYIVVGGMPSVVDVFLKTSSIKETRREQKNILEGYKDDYGKHLDSNENEKLDLELLSRINQVYGSIPSQLAKENKKFMVSKINSKKGLDEYETAIQWLIDYGLISKCFNVSNIEPPLEGNKISECFKLYVNDIGLFVSMLDDSVYSDISIQNYGVYKGAIYENIVADAFIKNDKKLFYFSKNSGLEIDFLFERNSSITLVEVKATNGNSKSIKTIMNNKDRYKYVNDSIKVIKGNTGYCNNIYSIPHYLSFLINVDQL